jgi:hypothetical protein
MSKSLTFLQIKFPGNQGKIHIPYTLNIGYGMLDEIKKDNGISSACNSAQLPQFDASAKS